MKIYNALQIGDFHLNHCEDYLFIGEVGNDKLLCAVMDGCTMAIDSYFASTLVGKILRKISVEIGYKEFYNLETKANELNDTLKVILKELFKELSIIKNQLMLERNELLTTLIILLLDKNLNKGVVLVVGDGLVSINGHITEYDQDNKPDYLGFHLGEDFEKWFDCQKQKLFIDEIQDISIATDGIFMFKHVKSAKSTDLVDPIEYLIHDKSMIEKEEMLSIKIKKLENNYGLKPTDDLAILRILNI